MIVPLHKEETATFLNDFFLFRNYLPLKKGGTLHLNKFESPSPGMRCAKFG